MGTNYHNGTGAWEIRVWSRPHSAAGLEWRQDWFVNLCLGAVLAAILFLMLLSIYLVFTKPAPSAIPEGKETKTAGSSYADITFLRDSIQGFDLHTGNVNWT